MVKDLFKIDREENMTLNEAEVMMEKMNYYAPLVKGRVRNRSLINSLLARSKGIMIT